MSGALGPDELAERLQDVHVLGIRSKMQVSRSCHSCFVPHMY